MTQKNFKKFKVSELKENQDNPRFIRDEKFNQLKQSIQDFPKMLEIRPLVIDKNNVIRGGNMRYRAVKDLGWKTVPCYQVKDLTEDELEEFVMKDNIHSGQWDWDKLLNDIDNDHLLKWGFDQSQLSGIEEPEFDEKQQKSVESTVRCSIGSYQIEVSQDDYNRWLIDLKSATNDPEKLVRNRLGL